MALTVTRSGTSNQVPTANSFLARGQIDVINVAFDSSYPTGGETLEFSFTPSIVIAEPNSGYVFSYDHTNSKLQAYYADYDAVADGALIEVADEADLSALTAVKVVAIKF